MTRQHLNLKKNRHLGNFPDTQALENFLDTQAFGKFPNCLGILEISAVIWEISKILKIYHPQISVSIWEISNCYFLMFFLNICFSSPTKTKERCFSYFKTFNKRKPNRSGPNFLRDITLPQGRFMTDKNWKKCVLKVFNFVRKLKFLNPRIFFKNPQNVFLICFKM